MTSESCQATAAHWAGRPWHMIHHNPSQNQPEILDQAIDNTPYINTIRKGHGPAFPAVLASHPHEAIIEKAALEVGAQLLLDVVRQLVLVRARALQKSRQVLGEDLVQWMFFWLTAEV